MAGCCLGLVQTEHDGQVEVAADYVAVLVLGGLPIGHQLQDTLALGKEQVAKVLADFWLFLAVGMLLQVCLHSHL